MVPDRKMFPAEEAMYVAKKNRGEGKSPLVPFTAGRKMVAEGGKEITKGERGFAYADGTENGRVFASRDDYERFVHQTGGALVSDMEDAAGPIKTQYANGELTASEAAALLQQLDRDAMSGTFNSLESIPRVRDGRVAAIRAIPADGFKLPDQPVRILSEDQINGEAGVRGLIAQNGSYYGNPENWELAYVVRPPKGAKPVLVKDEGRTISAKEQAFINAAQEKAPENLFNAATRPQADGTAAGGAPKLDDIARSRPDLTVEQAELLTEIANFHNSNGTPSRNPFVDAPTYGDIWLEIQKLHSSRWAPTLTQHRYVGELMIKANDLQAQLFPRGVRLPEYDRQSMLAELETHWGTLDNRSRAAVKGLFERMQSGGAPNVRPSSDVIAFRAQSASPVTSLIFPNLPANDPRKFPAFTVTHEVMHWLYRHGLTAKERAEFWRHMEKF